MDHGNIKEERQTSKVLEKMWYRLKDFKSEVEVLSDVSVREVSNVNTVSSSEE